MSWFESKEHRLRRIAIARELYESPPNLYDARLAVWRDIDVSVCTKAWVMLNMDTRAAADEFVSAINIEMNGNHLCWARRLGYFAIVVTVKLTFVGYGSEYPCLAIRSGRLALETTELLREIIRDNAMTFRIVKPLLVYCNDSDSEE